MATSLTNEPSPPPKGARLPHSAEPTAVVRSRDGVAVIDLTGDINAGAEQALNEAFTQASAQTGRAIVLNFDHVDYINSTGIALIVSLLARARRDRIAVTACGLSDHYREIFQITRLSDFMPMFDDENAAIAQAPATPDL